MPLYVWFRDGFAPVFAVVGAAADVLAAVFSAAMGVLDTVWNTTVKPIYNWFKNVFGDAFEAAGDAVDDLKGVFATAFNSIVDAVEGAMDLVASAIRTIVRAWNALEFDIPKVSTPFGDFGGGEFGTKDIHILGLANGTIGSVPTIAKLFERGPEAVIPLSDSRRDRAAELLEDSGLADRVRGGVAPVIQFTGGQTFQDATDVDLVAQKTMAATLALTG
jgi:hypothetical protein